MITVNCEQGSADWHAARLGGEEFALLAAGK